MAFANKNLSVIAYANGWTLWHYVENIKLSDICCEHFFNDVKTLMNIGDIIIINAADTSAFRRVESTNGGVVIAPIG